MDIYLVRHGEAAATWGEAADPGLSELGQREAEIAATVLAPTLPGNTLLISSPLARAQETAAPLARHLHLPVQCEDVFREVPSPVPLAQRQDWLREFMQQQWEQQPEPLHQWRAAACERLLQLQHSTVVFTHFLVINAVVGQLLKRTDTLCFWPANGSITHLRLQSGSLQLVALGAEVKSRLN